jgi:hypothetical protein
MKKTLLICIIMAAALWLSGCTILSFEEGGHTKRLRAACTPSQGILRVVHVPCPQSRPDQS